MYISFCLFSSPFGRFDVQIVGKAQHGITGDDVAPRLVASLSVQCLGDVGKLPEDVEAIEVDGQMIDKYVTRTERSGWGWWAKTVTFREFTYTDTATVTKDYTVCAVNGKGVSSDAITATLTVRPSVRDWLHGIFGKWF